MRWEFSLVGRSGRRRDLLVEAAPAATAAEVLAGFVDPAGPSVHDGADPVDLDQAVGAGPLRSGQVLTVGVPGDPRPWLLDGPALLIVGGAAAGSVHPLPTGKVVVGRAAPADLVVDDPTMSTRHASVRLVDRGLEIRDEGSSNGTVVGGVRVGDRPVRVAPGERFLLGQAVLQLAAARVPDGSAERGPDGDLLFNRVVRYRTPEPVVRVVMPTAPEDPARTGVAVQLVGSAAMLVTGVLAAVLLGNPLYAVLGVVAPVVTMGVILVGQRTARRDARRRHESFLSRRREAEDGLRAAAREEAEREWAATLDPASCALAAAGPTAELWSVDGGDETALRLRIGTHDRPARIAVQDAGTEAPSPVLLATPAVVDLRTHPVLGIAGSIEHARAAARALVHQVVVSRSPEDLVVVHLSSDGAADGWSWLRWLPHVRGADVHTVAPGAEALELRLEELSALVRQRSGLAGFGMVQRTLLPEVLVVLDGAGALRTRPAVVGLLQGGGALGIRVVAVDSHPSRLPAETSARLLLDATGSTGELQVKGAPPVTGLTVDLVAGAVAERSARALAPLVPLGGREGGALPDVVRLDDLVGGGTRDVGRIVHRWANGPEGRAVLGVDDDGRTVSVDLVDDGPHALVAGTVGAGKSEALRALVAGLVLSAGPADLSLLLIDFKGGGAFGRLATLPHVVGYADDLTIGGHLADRLLTSLAAELDLRKARFKAAGNVDGLRDYRSARRRLPELPPVSRLVIVIDEFAELKAAQPDFVDGLVRVARVGRSLGVHLVLATQQPAGVVTPQILDNSNLRLCLRVLDPGTSQDLVGGPEAAGFPHRAKGRAALRVGERSAVTIQTAWVSGPVRSGAPGDVAPPVVRVLPWSACGVPVRSAARAEDAPDGRTDLDDLVGVVDEAAAVSGQRRARRPWLPPLPATLLLDRLTAATTGAPEQVPFALEDRPAEQTQVPFTVTIGGGNVAVVGGQRSGRSTALRTLVTAVARRVSPDDLHVYVIDHTPSSALRALARLPHCGVVATRTERHRTERLVERLAGLAARRSALLAEHGVSSWAELRRARPLAPAPVLVVLDGWDSLVQSYSGHQEGPRTTLLRLLDEGPALGIQFAVAGGIGVQKILGAVEQVLCLRFEQRDQMGDFGVPHRELPTEIAPGRAHRPGSGDAVQIALLAEDPGTEAQNAVVGQVAADCAQPVRDRPFRLDDLPARIDLSDALRLAGRPAGAGPRSVLVGVGGDELAGRWIDLDRLEGPLVVTGPAGLGCTGALVSLAAQLVTSGVPTLVVVGRVEDEHRFGDARVVDPRAAVELVPGTVLLVDDAGRVADDAPLLTAAVGSPGVRLVLGGDPARLGGYGGWRLVARGVAGLWFSPRTGFGELTGTPIGSDTAFSAGPGRALLSHRGDREVVQVPWAG
ncbi:FtsK/SpoIIIE domain-containing protein [Klenkia sp. LSe6-5]|uniref:FtsK/SpoIIIE domain-containing protein n=1 Tax=Klenkia sesuvii TaxID=3103137 RepID=A0ABU8DW06_9ACTN